MIPLCDVKQQYLALKDEIDAAMQAVAADGNYILGPNVKAFEQEIAAYCQCQHAVGVASGTDALHLALRALRIGPGDEVITTPFTFVAATEAILLVGATPVFVDIDPQTFNIDPILIESAISARTKAILPVHLYGQPCDMAPIMELARNYGLYVVEDGAQSLGAQYGGRSVGTFGDAGCFSFFPSKNLGCFGDGGMIVTNNPECYERVEMLRRHGGRIKYHHEEVGLNSRLDEVQAAILRIKLQKLDAWNQLRRQAAYRYNTLLSSEERVTRPVELADQGLSCPTTDTVEQNPLVRAVYHQYTVLVNERDTVKQFLQKRGIECAVYYPIPLHLQVVHKDLRYQQGDFVRAESLASHCLSLPMFPELQEQQQVVVVDCLRDATKATIEVVKAA